MADSSLSEELNGVRELRYGLLDISLGQREQAEDASRTDHVEPLPELESPLELTVCSAARLLCVAEPGFDERQRVQKRPLGAGVAGIARGLDSLADQLLRDREVPGRALGEGQVVQLVRTLVLGARATGIAQRARLLELAGPPALLGEQHARPPAQEWCPSLVLAFHSSGHGVRLRPACDRLEMGEAGVREHLQHRVIERVRDRE